MSIAPVQDLSSYFASAVEAAIQRCAIGRDSSIERHLAALLAARAAAPGPRGSVVLELDRALASAPELRADALGAVGDHALYTRGFLGVPSHEEPVYAHCGALAFEHASRCALADGARATLFAMLSQRFIELSDVLAEVAVAQSLGARTRDLVRLYDAYKRSRSPSALEAMANEGVFPSSHDGGDA